MPCACTEVTPLLSRADDSEEERGAVSSESESARADCDADGSLASSSHFESSSEQRTPRSSRPSRSDASTGVSEGADGDGSTVLGPFLEFGFTGLDASASAEAWQRALAPPSGPGGSVARLGAVFHLAHQGFPWRPTPAYADGAPAGARRHGGLTYLSWSELGRRRQSLPPGAFVSFHLSDTGQCPYVSGLLADDPEMHRLIGVLVEQYGARHVHMSGTKLLEVLSSAQVAAILRLCEEFPTTSFVMPISFFHQVQDLGSIPGNLCASFDESGGMGKIPDNPPKLPDWFPAGPQSYVGFMGGLDATNAKEWLDHYAQFAMDTEWRFKVISVAMSGFRQERKRSNPIDVEELQKLGDSVREWATALAERRTELQREWEELKGRTRPWENFLHERTLEKADRLVAHLPPRRVRAVDFAIEAVKAVRWVTLVLWLFALLYPFVVFKLSNCPQATAFSPAAHPIASYPVWVWLFFLPVVGYAVYCEAQALRWILCTLVMYEMPFRCLYMNWHGMTPWLAFTAATGFAAKMDIPSNGLFLATLLKTAVCADRSSQVQAAWSRAVRTSWTIYWIPGCDQLSVVLLLAWGVTFLQPLLLIVYSLPLEDLRDGACKYKGHSTLLSSVMRRVLGKEHRVYPADVLQHMAIVNRMVSIYDRNIAWTVKRAKEELATKKPNRHSRAMDMIGRELGRLADPAMVQYLCKGVILELQVTTLAFDRSLTPLESEPHLDWQMVLSVAISAFTLLKSCAESVSHVIHIGDIPRLVEAASKSDGDIQQSREEKERITEKTEVFNRLRRRYWLALFVLCFFVLHCGLKFIMVFVCEDSIWDLPFFKASDGTDRRGCVEPSWRPT